MELVVRREREIFLSTCMCKGHVRTQEEGGCLLARRRVLTRNRTLLDVDFGLPSFQNCAKINFCYLSHVVCDILLWQSKQTNIDIFTSKAQNKQTNKQRSPLKLLMTYDGSHISRKELTSLLQWQLDSRKSLLDS